MVAVAFASRNADEPAGQPITPVAEAFGHQASGTEDLERQLREAVAAKDWDRAKRLSGQLAKQGRQAG